MRFKSSDWVMFTVIGVAVLLLLIWAFKPKETAQFIDTESIQIDSSK